MPCVGVSTSNVEEIREKSHIFGKNNDKANLTPYQLRINKACEELCVQSPQLLLDKGERLKQARMKVHNDGYVYKKGHSRSQQYNDAAPSQPKRVKICKDERDQRILNISEQMGDLDRLIRIKERRIEEATTTRSFAAADQLAKEVRTYKQERVQLRTELATLQKKEKRHKSYIQKKQQPPTESECPDESVVDLTDQSSDPAKGPMTNEADESEQITCSDPSDQIFQ